MKHLNLTFCHLQHVPAIIQAFSDKNVSFMMRGGLQVLVMLADPNAGTLSVNRLCCSCTRVDSIASLGTLPPVQEFYRLMSLCCVTLGYHGAAGGPGVWAVAVLFLITIMAAGSFILYKFKR